MGKLSGRGESPASQMLNNFKEPVGAAHFFIVGLSDNEVFRQHDGFACPLVRGRALLLTDAEVGFLGTASADATRSAARGEADGGRSLRKATPVGGLPVSI